MTLNYLVYQYSHKGRMCVRHGAKIKRCSSDRAKDAQVLLKIKREECALSMVPRSNDAAVMDAQIMPLEEEFALSMEQ